MSDESQTDRQSPRTTSEIVRGWWPGWIWAVPLAVILVVGWLGIRALMSGGQTITIAFKDAHGVEAQTTAIVYRGTTVGHVSAVALNGKADGVVVTASIDDSATRFLKAGTRFWLRGAHPSLSDLSSLGALLSGPTIVLAPGDGKKTSHFAGLTHKPLGVGPHPAPQSYIVSFDDAAGALSQGDPVTLRGFVVGRIKAVGFRYDRGAGALHTPVTLALYPSLFHFKATASGRKALRAAITTLIGKGLRARLERDPPVVGGYRVTLAIVPGAATKPEGRLDGLPEIPVAPGGGLSSVVSRFNKVPIDQIAQNVLGITHHVDRIVSSPALKDSIAQLDATLRQIHKTTKAVGPKVTKLVASLRHTATQLDEAARAADKTLGGPASQTGLHQTMREIGEAARSLRALADYLDRHPEALINGRSGG